ncbi:hypothetical protein JKP88DRAFT_168316 [Tribonema minus]|uniref:FGFR1 oncogene partner (FOP) N-terminal dimerisation domain-containing protein n=1 Tax=Tribonema minus TaxID=303371 RepID=A0A835YQT6_9STRA|nr:hypothetical protein JKP88DRAFT_168316 [Tribonema minus]
MAQEAQVLEADDAPLQQEGAAGTLDDLKDALVDALESSGALGKLRARVRAEVFKSLEPEELATRETAPPLSNANLIINELIRDYFEYNGYSHALSVFLSESCQPDDASLSRGFIRDELGVSEELDSARQKQLPLLYGILHMLQKWKRDSEQQPALEGPQASPQGTDVLSAAYCMWNCSDLTRMAVHQLACNRSLCDVAVQIGWLRQP